MAIAETEIGREREAAPRRKVHAGDASRLDDPVGHGILGARALVLEHAVGLPAIDPEEHPIPAPRERVGADAARPVADEFCEGRFFVVIVRGLPANLPPAPGGERIGLARLLRDRRGGTDKEKCYACEDCFQATTPLRCWVCARSSTRFDQPSILRHVPDGVPGLAEG